MLESISVRCHQGVSLTPSYHASLHLIRCGQIVYVCVWINVTQVTTIDVWVTRLQCHVGLTLYYVVMSGWCKFENCHV